MSKEAKREYDRKRYLEIKVFRDKQIKEWDLRNREQRKVYNKQWHLDNKVRRNREARERAILNRDKYNERWAKYKARKLKACPDWSEKDMIKIVYEKAKWLETLTGLKYHVDHIVPLQGKDVCGLHCWYNLQILEASINIAKGNRPIQL